MSDYLLSLGVIVFVFGSCIGSFLNVCIYRIPENKSIVFPGSFCPSCKNAIPFYLNIPILSYIFLMGKCKFCNIKISIRYPLIEILTGIFALLLFQKFGLTPAFFYWFVFISTLITISFIDFDHQIIPDTISLPGIIIFASSFYFFPEEMIYTNTPEYINNILPLTANENLYFAAFINTILGILVGGGSLFTVIVFYYLLRKQEGMGGGDVKLLAMIGAATGFNGVFFTIFTGSLSGTIVGVSIMIYTRSMDLKYKIPFGPFLSAGAILYIFYGEQLIRWYLGVL